MIGRTLRPASLFAFAFFKEAAAIADPILDPLDCLLEDPILLALSTQALANDIVSSIDPPGASGGAFSISSTGDSRLFTAH
jgi:hypothetical protein